MANDDEARRERARRLREEIGRRGEDDAAPPSSPRELTDREAAKAREAAEREREAERGVD